MRALGAALVFVAAGAAAPACTKRVPARWAELRLPTEGLQQVRPRTDDHGYYADYAGDDEAALWGKVSATLSAAGYAPACNMFDGHVRGFARGEDRLAAKIDTLGGVLAFAIFDEQGKESLLHGACFGKYQVGPARRIK
jgi:hypothetical protein